MAAVSFFLTTFSESSCRFQILIRSAEMKYMSKVVVGIQMKTNKGNYVASSRVHQNRQCNCPSMLGF